MLKSRCRTYLQFRILSRKVIGMKKIFVWGIMPLALMLACGEQKEAQEKKGDDGKVEKKEGSKVPEAAGKDKVAEKAEEEAKPAEAKAATVEKTETPKVWTELALHKALRAANPGYSGNGEFRIDGGRVVAMRLSQCGITSIEPLRGMPLMMIDLQACPITDISALKGMPMVELFLDSTGVEDLSPLVGMENLQKLYIDKSNVKDLTPLKGLPIQELNMVGTRISDISALKGMPLKMLWLTDLPVKDISALAGSPLVSVTLHRTKVEDVSPLAKTQIQRIHIGGTPVTDLSSLANLPLTRLVFDPAKITKGIDGIRGITTMTQIGTKFEQDLNTLLPPTQFWPKYDAGEFSK